MVARSAITLLIALATSAAATVTPVTNWKTALGWDGVTLAASSIGTSVGAFNASSGSTSGGVAAQSLATSPQAAVGKPGGVFICLNVDWKPTCGYAVQPLNECILLSSPWVNAVSSFGPDPGATCFAYSTGNCNQGEAEWSFTFPGDDTGGVATTNPWNDKITSFACVPS